MTPKKPQVGTVRVCGFCGQGKVLPHVRIMRFSQETDRGRVDCSVSIPIGECDTCGAEYVDEKADALIEKAVREAYAKLAPKR